MRCRYCGVKLTSGTVLGLLGESRRCPRCARLKRLLFVEQQGDGVATFREVMLGQNPDEPSRKLLETESFHFTVFIDASNEICGFDLADEHEAHLLKWQRGKSPRYYRV